MIQAVGSKGRKIRFEVILPYISILGYRTYLKTHRPGTVAYPSTQGAEASESLRVVQSQPTLQNKFQDSQGYTEKTFLEISTFASKTTHINKRLFGNILYQNFSDTHELVKIQKKPKIEEYTQNNKVMGLVIYVN